MPQGQPLPLRPDYKGYPLSEKRLEKEKTIVQMVRQLMKNTGLDAAEAMTAMGIPQEEQDRYIAEV